MNKVYSDRSTCTTHQACPRDRYWQHEFLTEAGYGIVSKKANVDLLIGSGFHIGVKELLDARGEVEAVGVALAATEKVLRDEGLAVEEGQDESYVAGETVAMVEALIRGYNRIVLPNTLERFVVLSTEQEELSSFTDPGAPGFEILFGGRTDGILLERDSQDLYVLSLKTKKEWKAGDDKKNRTDTQGLTEVEAVEQRLKKWHSIMQTAGDLLPGEGAIYAKRHKIPDWFMSRFFEGHSPVVQGVTMQYALKGAKRKDKFTGTWKYSNPLIRPWKKSGPAGDQWAAKWEFQDPMGGNHTLGKGWRVVDIWAPGEMGVSEWISRLEENVQDLGPGAVLAGQFVQPMDYFRNEEDRSRRVRQIVFQEERVEEGRQKLRELEEMAGFLSPQERGEYTESILDKYFPMHSDYPVDCGWCPNEILCYGPREYLFNPLSSGMFRPRVSNHPIERELRGNGLVTIAGVGGKEKG